MNQSLYLDLFAKDSTPTIVLNIFDSFPTNTYCDQVQTCDVLKSTICEENNNSTYFFPKNLPVHSPPYWEYEEFDVLNHEPVSVRTPDQIKIYSQVVVLSQLMITICIQQFILQNHQYFMTYRFMVHIFFRIVRHFFSCQWLC